MWFQFFRGTISPSPYKPHSLCYSMDTSSTQYTPKSIHAWDPPWEHTLFLIYFPILSPVCLREFSFFCVLLSGICVPSNVERNKVDNKENKRVSPQKRKKKTLTRRKRENKTDRYTESRRANECHSNRRRERKRESINYLVKVTWSFLGSGKLLPLPQRKERMN